MMAKRKLSDEDYTKIAYRYFEGASYKDIMSSGVTRRQLNNALSYATKKWSLTSSHINMRKLVALAHRQGGYVTKEQVAEHTGWKSLSKDKYRVAFHTLEEMHEYYGDSPSIDEAYTPIVLVGV
jgi:hypothetical protein